MCDPFRGVQEFFDWTDSRLADRGQKKLSAEEKKLLTDEERKLIKAGKEVYYGSVRGEFSLTKFTERVLDYRKEKKRDEARAAVEGKKLLDDINATALDIQRMRARV